MSTILDSGLQLVLPDHRDWDRYVCAHPNGSVFHRSEMIRAYGETRGITPYACAALDANAKIVAMVVSNYIKTMELVAPVSSRAVMFGEPLCDPTPTGQAALTHLIERHDSAMRSRALYCEVRSICEPGIELQALSANGYQHHDYINYVVDVDQDPNVLWDALNKKVRQKIRSSIRKGVELRDDNTEEGIGRLHSLLQASYHRARIPFPDISLFHNTLRYLPRDAVRIRTAFLGNRPVASIISLALGNRVFSWYGGTVRIRGLSPFACIVWDDIRWASEMGYQYYDFGGAGWPHEDYGPRHFKAQFGGREVHYGRYTRTYSKVRLRLAEFGFQISRRLGVWS